MFDQSIGIREDGQFDLLEINRTMRKIILMRIVKLFFFFYYQLEICWIYDFTNNFLIYIKNEIFTENLK